MYFQNLKSEFEHHESLLRDLEKQASDYKAQGKMEAATRLEQQILLLKVSFTATRGLDQQVLRLKVSFTATRGLEHVLLLKLSFTATMGG